MPDVLRIAVSVATPLALLGLVVALVYFVYARNLNRNCPKCGVYPPTGALVCACGYKLASLPAGNPGLGALPTWVTACLVFLGCLAFPFLFVLGVFAKFVPLDKWDTVWKIIQATWK
jgi:hypothetical protein